MVLLQIVVRGMFKVDANTFIVPDITTALRIVPHDFPARDLWTALILDNFPRHSLRMDLHLGMGDASEREISTEAGYNYFVSTRQTYGLAFEYVYRFPPTPNLVGVARSLDKFASLKCELQGFMLFNEAGIL
ncbi:hypothetical protein HIM_06594 [Hirsutella minnesotensis 3608]|uniref:Uncharacterized protein n=1 Tax=Hirsutella minnesotensis 3608 TaxID=1043627 RepID=A0A0F7ZIR1_9HYPO|nr:hypothetical protein HIM_06594 [Hirsutella minnesotensis 3608]